MHNIGSYVLGRVIRILPLYILTLLVYSAFGYFTLQDAYTIFKLNSPWGHLWTIAVEFKFYFLLPFIAFILIILKRSFGNIVMLLAAVIMIAIQQWYYPYYDVKPSSTDMVGYISAFIPGMCCAVLLSGQQLKNNVISDVICFCVLAGIMLSIPQMRKIFLGIPNDGYLLDKHVHFAFVWSIFLFFALSSRGLINKTLCKRVFCQLGKWSFSIYLFHWLIYTQLTKHFAESYAWAIFALFLAIITGGVIYTLFEKPLELYRHRLMRKVYGVK